MDLSYSETLEFLFSRLPVFQRIGEAAYKPGLDIISNFCAEIGNPQNNFPSIHIAGTNGKGSSSHSISSVLQEAGYKTGLYTSPHIFDFRERIRINGSMISESEVVQTIYSWKYLIEKFEPSFFELTVALAFHHFAAHKVDVAVIEVGMGGRLDSTNIISPEVCLITNISYDHQKFLGNTLAEIAFEKAGILKPGVPSIIGEIHPETKSVFETRAKSVGCQLHFAQEIFSVQREASDDTVQIATSFNKEKNEIRIHHLSLLGNYQIRNLPGILSTLDVLIEKGWKISKKSIKDGLSKVQENTGLMGRWQIIQKQPLVIADTAHNEAGIKLVLEQIQAINANRRIFIWGMVNDKNHTSIIDLLPRDIKVFVTEPSIPRKLPKEDLYKFFKDLGFEAFLKNSVKEALEHALNESKSNDLIFIGGSTFTVSDIPFEKLK